MKSDENNTPKLTKNDQVVLKHIIEHAKMPDADIAKKIGLSPQAVFKIRHKLEEKGIITGYQPVISLKKLGISVLCLMNIKFSSKVWTTLGEQELAERIRKIPYVISAYRVFSSNESHVLVMGFRDTLQMQGYITRMQTNYSDDIIIVSLTHTSIEHVITDSRIGLLYEMMDKKEFRIKEFILK